MSFKITESIVNEELYRKDLRKHYDAVLNNRIFSIDTRTAKDEDLLSFLSDYDTEKSENDNFFTWLSIGDIVDSEYNARPYRYVVFLTTDGRFAFSINFTQFKYAMSEYNVLPSFDENSARHVCTVDGSMVDPDDYFSAHKGDRILCLYSFDANTKYGRIKRCYRFALANTTPSHVRKYLRQTQITFLRQTLSNPTAGIPETAIRFLGIIETGITELTSDFASKLFEQEYKDRFLTKLNEIEKG